MFNSYEEHLINEEMKDFISKRKADGMRAKIINDISNLSSACNQGLNVKSLCQEIHRDILNIEIESALELKLSLLFLFVEIGVKCRVDYIETTLARAISDVTDQVVLFKNMRVEYFEPAIDIKTGELNTKQTNNEFSPNSIIELYKNKSKEIKKYSKKFSFIIDKYAKVLEDKLVSGDINVSEETVISEDESLAIKELDTFLEFAHNLGIDIDFEEELIQENMRGMVKTASGNVRRVARNVDRTIDNVGDTIVDGGKKREILKVRQEIMRGRKSFSHLFKIALATIGIASGALPNIGIPALVIYLIRHKKIKDKEKRQLLAELKSELEIVNEKIKDAEADNDRKKKYEYIRLRREIQRGIEQIRFNQKINLQRDNNIKL